METQAANDQAHCRTDLAYGAPSNNGPEPSALVLMAAGPGLLLRRDHRRGGGVQVV